MSVIDSVGFVHLHVHTSYSLREGALTIGKLTKLAAADRQPALAITDTNNLFGALEFSEKAVKDGIQPIIGLQLTLDFGDGAAMGARHYESAAGWANVVLIAQNEIGYRNLMQLASASYLETAGELPHLSLPRLAGHTEGLIVLTGGPTGPLDRACFAGRPQVARTRLDALTPLFDGRLYVELQRHGLESERSVEPQLLDLAYRAGLPLVATNEPFFAARSDHEAHDALLCIAEGTLISDRNRRQLSPEHRFKTRAEMLALFADLPEATRHSVEIAMRASFRPATRKPILPRFTTGDGADETAELRRQAQSGLAARLAAHGPAPGFTIADYNDRLAFELDVIEKMKFPGYFLIVADFIKRAKSKGIPVGPGRGSGAGSLVA